MTNRNCETQQQFQSTARVLENTSDAMQALHATLKELEQQLLDEKVIASGNSPPVALQAIDFLSQSIIEVGALLNRIGTQIPGSIMIESSVVIQPIKLECLRGIITNGVDGNLIERKGWSAGAVSLF